MKIKIVLLMFLISGCANFHQKEVEIISGGNVARIEIDGNFVGETPLKTILYEYTGGFPHCDVVPYQVVAYPKYSGECLQRKEISKCYNVPSKIYFDTRLCPSNEYEVNINN